MRAIAREKLGYYPLPPTEAARIRTFLALKPGADPVSILDPCAGTGAALATITAGTGSLLYGIELDAFRAREAERLLNSVVHGNVFDTHCSVESFSCIFENRHTISKCPKDATHAWSGCSLSTRIAG